MKLDQAAESLTLARAQLKTYRQALLKAAFEGRLTADWRAANPDKLEPPETLLDRIRAEREARYARALDDWQTALAEWRAGGEVGSRPRKPAGPRTQDVSNLGRISNLAAPLGWTFARLGSVLDVVSGGTPKGVEDVKGDDFPFYKVADMNTATGERWMSSAKLSLSHDERDHLGLTAYPAGTVIFPKRGGAILTNKKRQLRSDSCFDLNIMGAISGVDALSDDFVWYWFQGLDLSDIFDGSNVPQINNKNVEPLVFPICSRAEQDELTAILSAYLSQIDAMKVEVDAGLIRVNALRQSILKKAFSGGLVPQDPDDEPASILLERTKAEKAEKERAAKQDRKFASTLPPSTRRPTLTDLLEVLKKEKPWISAAMAAKELGISDGASSDDVEAFYRQLKEYVEDGTIEVERRGDEDWLRLAKAEAG